MVPVFYWQADGRHHMLYTCYDRRAKKDKAATALGGIRRCTCYAISDDAYHWARPELGMVEYEGSKRNNMIEHVLTGTPLIDPTAPPEQRFRAMGQEGESYDPETGKVLENEEAGRRFKAAEQGGPSYTGPRVASRHWIAGWTSPDGIHWNRLPEHLADMPSDGGTAAQYDAETGTYFAYLRAGGMGRRAIGFSGTDTFWQWTEPTLVLAPDPQDDPEVSFYGMNYFRYPGRNDLHGGVLMLFHQRTDHMDSQFTFSRDGIHWQRPERRACIPVGPAGSEEEGMNRTALTGINLLPDGSWAALYEGNSMLHNATGFMIQPPGIIRWARWQPHRFCGVEAEHEGHFTIPNVKRTADQLRFNYRAKIGGYVEAELIHGIPSRVHPDAPAIEGYSFNDCDRLYGDSLDAPMTWNGKGDLSRIGDTVAIRIRMFQAKLFAYAVGSTPLPASLR